MDCDIECMCDRETKDRRGMKKLQIFNLKKFKHIKISFSYSCSQILLEGPLRLNMFSLTDSDLPLMSVCTVVQV